MGRVGSNTRDEMMRIPAKRKEEKYRRTKVLISDMFLKSEGSASAGRSVILQRLYPDDPSKMAEAKSQKVKLMLTFPRWVMVYKL